MADNVSSVLFVCLGNICRSPLAEAILRHKALQIGLRITVDSAGTGSWHVGEPPCDNAIKVAELHGLDIRDHRARQVSAEDAHRFDIVIGLDDKNVSDLKAMGMTNVYKLGAFGCNGEDVPDPYFFDGFEGFETVFSMIERCCTELINTLVSPNSLK
jgi:protein-tyrosine phosphatase